MISLEGQMTLTVEDGLREELKRSLELDSGSGLELDSGSGLELDSDNVVTRTIHSENDRINIPYENALIGNFYLTTTLDLDRHNMTISIHAPDDIHSSTLHHNIVMASITGRKVIKDGTVTKIPLYWCDMLLHKIFPLYKLSAAYPIMIYADTSFRPMNSNDFSIQYDCYYDHAYDMEHIAIPWTYSILDRISANTRYILIDNIIPDKVILHKQESSTEIDPIIYDDIGLCLIPLRSDVYDLDSCKRQAGCYTCLCHYDYFNGIEIFDEYQNNIITPGEMIGVRYMLYKFNMCGMYLIVSIQ